VDSHKRININPEKIYKMPECLKELVDYKNSQDYLIFKQMHRQLSKRQPHLSQGKLSERVEQKQKENKLTTQTQQIKIQLSNRGLSARLKARH